MQREAGGKNQERKADVLYGWSLSTLKIIISISNVLTKTQLHISLRLLKVHKMLKNKNREFAFRRFYYVL